MYQIIKYFDLLNRLNFEIVSAKSSLDYRVSKYIQICAKIKELLLFLTLECVYIHLKKVSAAVVGELSMGSCETGALYLL